jgi:hypothetical protein
MSSLETELEKSKSKKNNQQLNTPVGFAESVVSDEAKINGNIIFDTLDRDKKGFITQDDVKPFFKHKNRYDHAFRILQLPVCDKGFIMSLCGVISANL